MMSTATKAAPKELSGPMFSTLRHWGRVSASIGHDPKSFSQRKLIENIQIAKAEGATQAAIAHAALLSPSTVSRYLALAVEPA